MASAACEQLYEHVSYIHIIDTHEHVPDEAVAIGRKKSLFSFFEHYVSSDLVSAGMPRQALEAMRDENNNLSLPERWALMAPYWPFARTTGYGRAFIGYMRDLFGIVDINEDSYAELSARIAAAQRPGWHREVLHDKARIDKAVVTTWPGEPVRGDRDLFLSAPIFDHYATVSTRDELQALEKEAGQTIQTLPQLMLAQEAAVDRMAKDGAVAVKIFLAYQRPLLFDRVEQAQASRVFDRVWLSQARDVSFDDVKPLQDFMTRRLIGLAADRRLPIQIHTGMQEGNGNHLANANPTLLTNLFLDFPDARFDVFHAGYPYWREAGVLAKYFANVYADLAWLHAISPGAAATILDEWLEIVPSNKILAVGGDSNYVEGAYGHTQTARRVTCDVLAAKVEKGYLSVDEAQWLATRILRENAIEALRLNV
jgi:glucuronate isomerase